MIFLSLPVLPSAFTTIIWLCELSSLITCFYKHKYELTKTKREKAV